MGVWVEDISETDGEIQFYTQKGTSLTKKMSLTSDGAFTVTSLAGGHAVFNEGGINADFSVESDANSAMLFVDGGENRVGVGTSTPGYILDVQAGAAATLNIGRSSAYEDFGRLGFSNSRSYIQSEIIDGTANGDTYLAFFTQSGGTVAERLKIELLGGLTTTPVAGGHAVFNDGAIDADFIVKSDGSSNMLFVDGGNNRIGIGDNLTNGALTIGIAGVGNYNQLTLTSTTAADANKLAGLTTLNYQGDNVSVFQSYNQSGSNTLYIGSADSTHRGYTAINTFLSSSSTATTNHRKITTASYSAFVVNEDGVDADFRVESDNDANALFVDGADGTVTASQTLAVGSGAGRSLIIGQNTGISGTTITTICTGMGAGMSSAAAADVIIYGTNNAGANFMDRVQYLASQSFVVVSSSTLQGSPHGRTYAVAGASLRVTMASGASGYRITTRATTIQYPHG